MTKPKDRPDQEREDHPNWPGGAPPGGERGTRIQPPQPWPDPGEGTAEGPDAERERERDKEANLRYTGRG